MIEPTAPNKFYVALAGVLYVIADIVGSGVGHVSNAEWKALVVAVTVALGVFWVSNPPTDPHS